MIKPERGTFPWLWLRPSSPPHEGTNTFQWPEGVPYSYARSRETQQYVWDLVVKQQALTRTLTLNLTLTLIRWPWPSP